MSFDISKCIQAVPLILLIEMSNETKNLVSFSKERSTQTRSQEVAIECEQRRMTQSEEDEMQRICWQWQSAAGIKFKS